MPMMYPHGIAIEHGAWHTKVEGYPQAKPRSVAVGPYPAPLIFPHFPLLSYVDTVI